jgi:tetratricopeptide (TPR) repeat protein
MFLGTALQRQGNIRQSIESYSAAINLDRNFAEAYLLRGTARITNRQTTQACEDFRRAETLGHQDAAALLAKYCR